jgi:acyl-CoA hydrolase
MLPKLITAADVPGLLGPGMVVYAPGLAGESAVFVAALRGAPEACAGVRFVGVWLPSINRVDYAGLHPEARASAFFIGRDFAASFAAGRIDFRPLSYLAIYAWLRDRATVDLALLHTSAPDADGRLSLGVANDFTPAILGTARIKVAHINPRMPRTIGAVSVPLTAIDYVVEADAPLLGDDDEADAAFDAIGRNVATLVRDGDTLEVGVGRVQRVLAALAGRRGLRLHTGAITTPLLRLVDAGGVAEHSDAITTGVALGGEDLYGFVRENPRMRFAPVGYTHEIATLTAIERFVAINSVIEVDLLGQANAEMIDGRQVGAAGGLVDFMRGARASAGGRANVALPATVKGGRVSRIVSQLSPGTAVSVARGDMDIVVTEHGVADLREKTVDERAAALSAIAAPPFRDGLARAWAERRRHM